MNTIVKQDVDTAFQQILARTPDPETFALVFPEQMAQAIEKAKTPEDANMLRALVDMGKAYLRQTLPKVIQDRHERYALMFPTEEAVIDVAARAGVLWDAVENKAEHGGDRRSTGNSPLKIAVDNGFKDPRDATTCVRIGKLDKQDLAIYKNECRQNERNLTISGAERVWLLLNPKIDMSEPETNPSRYTVSRGQVWKLGRHRVICGDACNLIDDLSADALVTDPPYGIGYKPDWNKWDGSKSDFNAVIGDEDEFNPLPFMDFPTVALFGANYFSNRLPRGGWLCWDKRTKEELDEMFGSPFELAWYRSVNTTRKAIMVRLLHGGVVNADSIDGNNEKRYHATQKPVALMETVLRELTLEEDVILDPFAGSGSTLLACERSNRTCIAVEIEPTIAAIILQRWADETGKEPCLE